MVIVGCTRGPTPESTCRELERAKLASGCTAGSTVHTESVPGTQWHFKLMNATTENDGVIVGFNNASEADAAYESVVKSDALANSFQTGFDQLHGKESDGAMHPVLPWRFAMNKPWTLILMPGTAGHGERVVTLLKSIYVKDGGSMNTLFYSGTKPMAMPVE